MFTESILAANLAALERAQGRRPTMAPLDPERVRAVPDDGQGLRLELRTAEGWVSLEGPTVERFPPQLFIIGPALGDSLDAIERADARTRVVAVEPDPGVAVLLLARRDWSRWIEDGRLRLITGPDYGGTATLARHVDVSEPPIVQVCPQLAAHRPHDVAAAQAAVRRLVSGAEANADARRRFAGRYLANTLANLPLIAQESNVTALDACFDGLPAVIVGAGPSLDDTLPELAQLQRRAIIIAADTALRPLLAGGVRPHLMTGVDPAPLNAEHLSGVDGLADVWLAAEGSLAPAAFTGFAGRAFIFKVSDHEPWPWLRAAGFDRGLLRTWGSVVTSALDLAVRMGCNPIVFTGLDLSYPVRRPYCRNTIFDQTWHDAIARYGCTWEQLVDDYFSRIGDLRRPDVRGTSVLTSPHLVAFRDWIVERTTAETARRFVNATGAGILHGPRIEQGTLPAVLTGPEIDAHVRHELRAGHARGTGLPDAVTTAASRLVLGGQDGTAAEQFSRWTAFSAGTLSEQDLRGLLERALGTLVPVG